ncbi:MAG: helix-turn-helix transcriptional regulator [Flavobacteriaceae bacterium]|nr:helix-turn-helix transcriptional regulator [Flavobacteriaceae bacterium]
MINSTEFANRLKKVMDHYQLSPSAFADKIQVQRSSISHLLSGRNKPSLDFVLKVIKEFDEIELYWLLNGKGVFPSTSTTPILTNIESPDKNIDKQLEVIKSSKNEKTIERIVMFYTDGTFKEFINQKK